MRANSYDAATGRTIGGTSAEFSLSGAGCTAEVEGPSAGTPGGLRFTYTNATGAMSVSGKPGLTFQDVSGCAGLLDLNEGDTATFHVSADITPVQTITSP